MTLSNRPSMMFEQNIRDAISVRNNPNIRFGLQGFVKPRDNGEGGANLPDQEGECELCQAGCTAYSRYNIRRPEDVNNLNSDDQLKLSALSSMAFNISKKDVRRPEVQLITGERITFPEAAVTEHIYDVLSNVKNIELPPKEEFNSILAKYHGEWTEANALNKLDRLYAMTQELKELEDKHLGVSSEREYINDADLEETEEIQDLEETVNKLEDVELMAFI